MNYKTSPLALFFALGHNAVVPALGGAGGFGASPAHASDSSHEGGGGDDHGASGGDDDHDSDDRGTRDITPAGDHKSEHVCKTVSCLFE